MICVECGTDVPGLVQGSCPACFAKKHDLLTLPEVLDVEVCAHCDARHVGAHWMDAEDGAPLSWAREDAVREATRVHARAEDPVIHIEETPEDEKHFAVTVLLEAAVEGVPMEAEARTKVRVRRGVCDRCSRLQGGFYAAIIQLRATERDVSPAELGRAHRVVADQLERQRLSGNRFSFLAKDGPMHGGHDYYVGDIEAARQVCRDLKDRLGATVQESAKLVGRREGEDVYRVTFLVRIRLFAPGDFADWDGRVVQVLRVDRGHAAVLELTTHRRDKAPEARLKRLGGDELVEEAVVVSCVQGEVQLLDPVTHRTEDVPLPADMSAPSGTARVIRSDAGMLLVPGTGNGAQA